MEYNSHLIAETTSEIAERRNGSGLANHQKSLVYLETLEGGAAPPNAENHNPIIDTLYLLRERAWVIALIAIVGGLVGAGLTFVQSPIYEARATLEIQPPVENVFGMQGGAGGGTYQPESFLQTQIKVLQSRSLAGRVMSSLRARGKLSTYTPPDRLAAWRKVLGMPALKTNGLTHPTVPPFELKVHSFDGTQVVEITCDSPDPNFSADYINTMTDEFMTLSMDSRLATYQNTASWMNRQLGDMRRKLEDSERELQDYSASSGLLYTDEKDAVQSDRLKQIQEELSKAQGERFSKQAVFETATLTAADAIPQVIDNERLSGYQTKITELRRELADLSSLYTPEHYKVVQKKAQIAEVEAAFKRDRDAILGRIRNEYDAAIRREKLLLANYNVQAQLVSAQAAKSIHYDVLKREVDTDRQLYGTLISKVKEASVASALASNNMHVMDAAEPPQKPYKPDIISNLLKGLGAGVLLGLFSIVSMDRINQSLRAPGEAPFHLRVPELGVIPSEESLLLPRFNGPPRPKNTPILLMNGIEAEAPQDRVELVTWQNSNSLVAESFRNTLASILLSSNGNRPRVIMVTSANREEGKSTTVSNLGIGLAEINQKILLIDADMRKPRLHNLFELSNSWGLSDLLREKTILRDSPIEALARPTKIAGLWVLPSGPGTLSISNLLYSERMAQLLERFRDEFDTILIDTPPMLTISDARILGRLADGAILVIRAGQTTKDAAMTAKERLVDDGIRVIGTILNRWDLKAKTRYGNGGYYYVPPS